MAASFALPVPAAIAGLLLLAIGPRVVIGESVGPVETEAARKALIALLFAPAVLRYWIEARFLLPVAAYAALVFTTFAWSDSPSNLTPTQTLDSFVSLSLGWIIIAVRWGPQAAPRLLRAAALLPLVSVLLGGTLAVFELGFWYERGGGGVPRLGGATIPPPLAMLAVVGMSAAVLAARLLRDRFAWALVVANFVILSLTLSRGALAVGGVVLLPVVARYFWTGTRRVKIPFGFRAATLVLLLVAIFAALAPAVVSRNEAVTSAEGYVNTSGRLGAWEYFWDQGQVAPLFGRGLGSGPVIGENLPWYVAPGGDFTAQHNEYLRMFLEGGYVGFAIVLSALTVTLLLVKASFPRPVSSDAWALVVALALLSTVDNTLSSPEFITSFAVVAGAVRSVGRLRAEPDQRKQLV
jgi:O-antigen ligase